MIQENRATTFLKEIVAIPSLSSQEAAVAERCVAEMQTLGFDDAFVDLAGNAVGERQGDPVGETSCHVVLLGHIDTVPGDIPVRIEDGVLHGRGTVDAKGPFATFVMAAAAANLPPGCRVTVIGATEEESATSKGARYARDHYRPDYCIIGEPSGVHGITLGYKGRLLLDYELHQPMGHTAGPESGPAEAAVAFWNHLEHFCGRFNAGRERLFDQLLPSIRHLETGSDGLTNSAVMHLGFRLPPKFDVEQLKNEAKKAGGEAEIAFRGIEAAYHTGRSNPLYRAFSTAIRQHAGRPVPKLKTGTSDMNVVGPVWNCPIVAYGPGDSSLDHTPHEHIALAEYLQAIEILKDVLENL